MVSQNRMSQPLAGSKAPLYGALVLLLFAIGATIFGQTTGIGVLKQASEVPDQIRDIRFLVGADDVLTIADARSGEAVARYAPTEGGFVRGSLRGIMRDRKLRHLAEDEAFRLILWEDGRLTLSDTLTGQRYPLDSFGATNAAAFAALLDERRTAP